MAFKLFGGSQNSETAVNNILVIRFSSIGDIVLTTPVLRTIKRKYPHAKLHFLVKEKFKDIIVDNEYVDVFHYFRDDLNSVIRELKAIPFDTVIDLHHNLRSEMVKKSLGVPRTYSFPKLNFKKWLYTGMKIDTMPDKSVVERYFEAVQPIGVRNDGEGLDVFIPENKATLPEDLPFGHWVGFVGCVIGGTYATKRLPVEKWKAFCRECPFPVVLLGGPEDRSAAEEITRTDPVKIYNSCGKFKLIESADLVQRARVIVTNDTGLMHVAAAFKKPVVSLWGNTTPEMGMFPYYGANNLYSMVSALSTIIEVKGLKCRPCSKIGFDKCPKGHFNCMNQIPVEKIVEAVKYYWQLKPKEAK